MICQIGLTTQTEGAENLKKSKHGYAENRIE